MAGVSESIDGVVRRVAALVAAWLPRRWWPWLEQYVPVSSSAVASGILTLTAGVAIGFPGFLEHASGTSRAYVDMLVDAADRGEQVMRSTAVGMNALGLFTFLLLTPKGWATCYLFLTGSSRAIAAWFDDPFGDPVLSLADAGAVALVGRRRDRGQARRRERLEGPAVRDIVVSGARAGIEQAELVIIASRRKPGWDFGTVVITPETIYRVGIIVERTIEGRLRTLYPLTEHRDYEAFRRTVHYQMPAARETMR